mmetsp:Transcript_15816/g.48230  ORF Transcript_15816/g.48230 Transcript_15816/m.48230 type:complete len:208 (+) Transcript_15816:219-842(+)
MSPRAPSAPRHQSAASSSSSMRPATGTRPRFERCECTRTALRTRLSSNSGPSSGGKSLAAFGARVSDATRATPSSSPATSKKPRSSPSPSSRKVLVAPRRTIRVPASCPPGSTYSPARSPLFRTVASSVASANSRHSPRTACSVTPRTLRTRPRAAPAVSTTASSLCRSSAREMAASSLGFGSSLKAMRLGFSLAPLATQAFHRPFK